MTLQPRLARLSAYLALPICLTALGASSALAESPRSVMVEVHGGPFQPQVDEQFTNATPYKDTFGDESMFMFGFHVDYQLWQDHGALAVGGGLRIGWVDGNALNDDNTASEDETALNLMPINASVTYRWDWAAIEHGIPLVPYVKAGLTYAFWWVTDGKDDTASVTTDSGEAQSGSGGTVGWHAGGGIQLLLDALEPTMATSFDNEMGVNNSYIFFEFLYTELNDFGSSKSLNLGDAAFSLGLMFEI